MGKIINIKTEHKFIRYEIGNCYDCPFLDERCYTHKAPEFFCCVRGIDRETNISKEFKEKGCCSKCPLPEVK